MIEIFFENRNMKQKCIIKPVAVIILLLFYLRKKIIVKAELFKHCQYTTVFLYIYKHILRGKQLKIAIKIYFEESFCKDVQINSIILQIVSLPCRKYVSHYIHLHIQ